MYLRVLINNSVGEECDKERVFVKGNGCVGALNSIIKSKLVWKGKGNKLIQIYVKLGYE